MRISVSVYRVFFIQQYYIPGNPWSIWGWASAYGNLKRFRTEKGFSQEAFAAKIGVHVTNLSKYERNKSVPSLEIAEKMASVLDMSLDEMVYGQQNEKARIRIADNELLSLFNKTQQLPDDQKKTVVDLLSAFLLKANLKQQLT